MSQSMSPNVRAIEMAMQEALHCMPKGNELFVSDLHGEIGSF